MTRTIRIEAGSKSAVLGATEFVIGRSLYCTLVVDDGSVSRLHAALRRVGEEVEVADLGSCNGTFVNGEKLGKEPRRITPVDELKVGNLRIRMVLVAETTRERTSTYPALSSKPDDEPTGAIRDWPPKGTPPGGGTGG
jgi:pSer/pThr/pTyr-binding forkhead associated (FHA) protein